MKRWVVLNPVQRQCLVTLLSLGTTASCMISRKRGLTSLQIVYWKEAYKFHWAGIFLFESFPDCSTEMASERIIIAGLLVFIFCQAFSSPAGRFVQLLTWSRMALNVKWEKLGWLLCARNHIVTLLRNVFVLLESLEEIRRIRIRIEEALSWVTVFSEILIR